MCAPNGCNRYWNALSLYYIAVFKTAPLIGPWILFCYFLTFRQSWQRFGSAHAEGVWNPFVDAIFSIDIGIGSMNLCPLDLTCNESFLKKLTIIKVRHPPSECHWRRFWQDISKDLLMNYPTFHVFLIITVVLKTVSNYSLTSWPLIINVPYSRRFEKD